MTQKEFYELQKRVEARMKQEWQRTASIVSAVVNQYAKRATTPQELFKEAFK